MKQLDKLLIRSFVPPFIVTFFIGIFVLMMQTLWLYIDDIVGKGAGMLLIMEFLAYLSVSLMPMALPIAVLISSVMVMGNMAEHYELSSFKSAGVSLMRVMMPLMGATFLISIFSFFCNNNLAPISNLKFKSRLYDMRTQKPTLSLEEGVFNDDFDGYSIRISKKGSDDKTIEGVMIYDHRNTVENRMTQVLANEGEMYATNDNEVLLMRLYDGHQYVETKSKNRDSKYPFIRTNFDKWEKAFDLSQFEISMTDEQAFSSHYSMLTSQQLRVAIDSIDKHVNDRIGKLESSRQQYYYFEKKGLIAKRKQESDYDQRRPNVKPKTLPIVDSMSTIETEQEEQEPVLKPYEYYSEAKATLTIPEAMYMDTATIQSIFNTHSLQNQQKFLNKANSSVRSIKTQTNSTIRSLERTKENHVKHIYTLHSKYAMSFACFMFLFIGAPMGAIIRKGGFGYPILIAVIFFVIFIVITIFSRRIAESFVLPPITAAWLPCAILMPIGLILTVQAMNDSQLVNLNTIKALFRRLIKR